MTRPTHSYLKQLNKRADQVVTKYIAECFSEIYEAEIDIETKRYKFPELFTDDDLEYFQRQLTYAMDGSISVDILEFSVYTDEAITDEVQNLLIRLRRYILKEILEYNEWEEFGEEASVLSGSDQYIWEEYCTVRISRKMNTMSCSDLKQQIENYEISFDDETCNLLSNPSDED
jgi:hypothetical protein